MTTRRRMSPRPWWGSPISLITVVVITGIAVAGWLHFFVERQQMALNDRLTILERETQSRLSWRGELTAKVLENATMVQEMRYRLAACGCTGDANEE